MWRNVELRELRLFLVLAEELHFGRTAEKLGLTPSRVSQSVRALEDKVGAQLVHRTSRRVSLTASGEQFLLDVRPSLEQLDAVLDRASTRTVEGILRLGILSAPAGGPSLVEIIHRFEARHPAVSVEVTQASWDAPFERLRAGEIDLMAAWLPLEQVDLVVGPVLTEQPRALAMARDHPLAGREAVDVEELAEQRILSFDNWPRELRETITPSATPRGRPITRVRVPVGERSVSDVAVRVARGEVVYPTVASAAAYMGDMVFARLTGMPALRSALVWRRPARDPKLRAFIAVARETLGERSRSRP